MLRAPMQYIYHLVSTTLKNLGLNQPRNETTPPYTTYDITDITALSSLAHDHLTSLEHKCPDEVALPLIDKENNNYINRSLAMVNPSQPSSTCHRNSVRGWIPPLPRLIALRDNNHLHRTLIWHGQIETNTQDPCIGSFHIPCYVYHHTTDYS